MGEKLFVNEGLREFFESRERDLRSEVASLPQSDLPQVDENAWASALAEKYALRAPELDADATTIDEESEEVMLPVEQFRNGFGLYLDDFGPREIAGHRTRLHIPFKGDEELLRFRPSTYDLGPKPTAEIAAGELILTIDVPLGRDPDFLGRKQRFLNEVGSRLQHTRSDTENFNRGLQGKALGAIQARRAAYTAQQEAISKSGIPRRTSGKVRVRDVLTRRPRPSATPRNTKSPIEFEPSILLEKFDHIVDVIRMVGRDMEKSSSSYPREEEDLRQHIKSTLNTHYVGAAKAEAFNHLGRTDLLVTEGSANVFVGECKFWTGPKSYTDTLDQLFRYTTWRDVRLCAIIFVRAKGFSAVLQSADLTLKAHPQFSRVVRSSEAEGTRAEMRWPGDDRRIVTLHVLFIHLPDQAAADEENHSDPSVVQGTR